MFNMQNKLDMSGVGHSRKASCPIIGDVNVQCGYEFSEDIMKRRLVRTAGRELAVCRTCLLFAGSADFFGVRSKGHFSTQDPGRH